LINLRELKLFELEVGIQRLQPGNACEKNISVRGARGCNTDDQARCGDNTVVGAQDSSA
jgi:hypothetical protein